MSIVKRIKKSNASRILKYMFRTESVSRAQIAEDTEITPAAVTTTVTALIEQGIINDFGEIEQTDEVAVGRKRVLISLNPNYAYCIGIEFTQKILSTCLTNLKGEVIDKIVVKPSKKQSASITDEIIKQIHCILGRNKECNVIGIGIAVPGHMDEENVRIITNEPTAWQFDASRIRKEFNINVICENNVRAMAYGEYLFQVKNTPENFVFFHIGLGMYCASIIEGELFVGNNYVAGEIGHTIVNPKGRKCECGKYGCLQTFASESWLIKTCKYLYRSEADTILKKLVSNEDEITIDEITLAYSLGDPVVSSYVSEAITYLGITISNIAIIMNPEKIFIHGEIFLNNDTHDELTDYIQRQLLFVDKTNSYNADILSYDRLRGAIGASALAINCFFIENMN